MAGLYIHIPFCKSRCIYCGFYSTTSLELRQRYVDAVCKEMETRGLTTTPPKEEGRLDTVYLGGGTPSQLTGEQLRQLFIYINKVWFPTNPLTSHLSPLARREATLCLQRTSHEITMECNPDDVTDDFAELLSQLPVNRVSMGVQTFSNERLRFLNRRHKAEQIAIAVERLRNAGIGNISIDLMYGFPKETLSDWHNDVDAAIALDVEHISAYSLMYEEGTTLYNQLQRGLVEEISEETSLQMYNDLIDRLASAGYEHYEISNFAKKADSNGQSFRSKHNSSYWNKTPYIGLGAAAHSYDGDRTRRWNVDSVKQYIEGIEKGCPQFEEEHLDDDTLYNELVMTSLRTCEGLAMNKLNDEQREYCIKQAERFINDGLLTNHDNHLLLTRKGLFVSNMIMSELMKV